MERSELERKTIDVLSDKLEISSDQIKLETELDNELLIDSLDEVAIIMGIENEFDIAIIPDTIWNSMETVKDLCNLIESKLSKE